MRGTAFDIADVITRPDYGDPYGLVDKLLDGRVIRAVGNSNISYYASPQVEPRDRRGATAHGRRARPGLRATRDRVSRAPTRPLAAYAVLNARVFVSARVGCITYQPVYGLDLAGTCVNTP